MLNYYYELNICCVKKKQKNYWVVHKCCRRLEREGCILCMGALSTRLVNSGWCLWKCLRGSCFGSLSVIARCGMNEEAWKAQSQVGSGIEGKDVWPRLWASYPSSALTGAIPLSVFCLLELTMRFHFLKVQWLKKDIKNLACMFRSWLFRSWLFKTTPSLVFPQSLSSCTSQDPHDSGTQPRARVKGCMNDWMLHQPYSLFPIHALLTTCDSGFAFYFPF